MLQFSLQNIQFILTSLFILINKPNHYIVIMFVRYNRIYLFFKIYFYLCQCLCLCVSAHFFRYLWMPEEDFWSPLTGVTGGVSCPVITGNWILVLCISSMCSLLLSYPPSKKKTNNGSTVAFPVSGSLKRLEIFLFSILCFQCWSLLLICQVPKTICIDKGSFKYSILNVSEV